MRSVGDVLCQQVDIVFTLFAGRHAPVSRPADAFQWPMQRDTVAQEKHFANGRLSNDSFCLWNRWLFASHRQNSCQQAERGNSKSHNSEQVTPPNAG